jgi:hypothetical protein
MDLSKRRVGEMEVARVLNIIATPPNLRKERRANDLAGDYDEWFDGGARRMVTGYTIYQFANGTRAIVNVFKHLHIRIQFPEGTIVSVRQEDTRSL